MRLGRPGLLTHLRRLTGALQELPKIMNKAGRKTTGCGPGKIDDKSPLPCKFEVLSSPVKSFSDKKQYKVIRLENGLTACLVSDMQSTVDTNQLSNSDSSSSSSSSDSDSWNTESSGEYETDSDAESADKTASSDDETDDAKQLKKPAEIKLAATALCIGVGSFSDPEEVPGLAHFLEHMVFMGSEKYPKENDFDAFIKRHGGSDNASTDYEVTTFFFECFERHLLRSMDRFAQFFISPLMNKASMTREREAVESEFQLALPSDDYRREQLLVSLAHRDSPVNSFSWGNQATLRDNVTDERLYELLHEFRRRHYSAHRMTLAVQARLPIDILESYVIRCFGCIPNNKLSGPNFAEHYDEKVFETSNFNRLYYIKPVKDICQLELTWILPPLQRMYRSKPHEYILWLLNHEGKGSLLSYLKERVWALSISGEGDEITSSIYTQFSISIALTQSGLDNLNKVIEAVFSYLQMLRNEGPNERVFREIQSIEDVAFRFEEEEMACDAVEDIAENMQIYPPEDYLTGPELFFEFDPDLISVTLSHLVSTKVNIGVSATNTPTSIIYNEVEPWFKTKYMVMDIPADWIEAWSHCEASPEFHLPVPNAFLVENFAILPAQQLPEHPQKVLDTPLIELWYRKDQKFNLPMAHYYYYFVSPLAVESVESSCMMDIFVDLLNIHLSEEGYSAQIANLSYEIVSHEKGITLKFVGYNEKLPALISLVSQHIKNVSSALTPELFEAIKTRMSQALYNKFLKPSVLCREVRLYILQNEFITLLDKFKIVSKINYEDMLNFCARFLKHFYVHALIQGNVTEKEALETTENMLNIIEFTDLQFDARPKITVNAIPNGEHCLRVMSFSKRNANSVITNYYQCGILTIKDNVILDLILYWIEEPLFDILRTKEQLGYNVSQSVRDTYGILGYSFTVHARASKHKPQHIDSRIEAFIKGRYKALKRMNERKFRQLKRDLVKLKRCADVDLEDEVSRNWSEIIRQQYLFDRTEQEVAAISELQLDEVKKWWLDHNIFNSNKTFKKISFQVVGHAMESTLSAFEEQQNALNDAIGASLSQETIQIPDEFVPEELELKILEKKEDSKSEKYFIRDVVAFKRTLQAYETN